MNSSFKQGFEKNAVSAVDVNRLRKHISMPSSKTYAKLSPKIKKMYRDFHISGLEKRAIDARSLRNIFNSPLAQEKEGLILRYARHALGLVDDVLPRLERSNISQEVVNDISFARAFGPIIEERVTALKDLAIPNAREVAHKLSNFEAVIQATKNPEKKREVLGRLNHYIDTYHNGMPLHEMLGIVGG